MLRKVALFLVAALVVILVVQRAPDDTLQSLPELPAIDASRVTSFELEQQGKLLLKGVKRGEQWVAQDGAGDKPMNTDAVERLLTDLQQMQPKRLASRKVEHHQRFDVDASGIKLRLLKESVPLLELWIGKTATDLRSTYVRLEGDTAVVTVDKTLTWQVKRTRDAWLKEEVEQ